MTNDQGEGANFCSIVGHWGLVICWSLGLEIWGLPQVLPYQAALGYNLPHPMDRRKTLLILSQVFVPDPASVGQHMADVAAEMARRGHRVKVYASARGYE